MTPTPQPPAVEAWHREAARTISMFVVFGSMGAIMLSGLVLVALYFGSP